MKRNLLLWLFGATVLLMTSCQKEAEGGDNSSASDLFGEWKIVGMKMVTNTDITMSSSGENIRYIVGLNYECPRATTSGTYTFTADKITVNKVSYQPTGSTTFTFYNNGSLFAKETLPMESDPIVYSGSTNYKAVGSDSIYCPGGAIMNIADPSFGQMSRDVTSIPAGYKYKIEGNKLTLYLNMKGWIDMPKVDGATVKYYADWSGEAWMEKL